MGVRAAGYCHHHRLPTRESPYGFPQSPADSTGLPSRAPVFNDEEKRAGATTHVGTSTFPARDVPAEPQAIRAKLRGAGAGCGGQVGRWLEASETAEGRGGAQFDKRSLHAATTALRRWRTLKVTDPATPMRAIGSRRFGVTALLNRTPPRGQCAALPC